MGNGVLLHRRSLGVINRSQAVFVQSSKQSAHIGASECLSVVSRPGGRHGRSTWRDKFADVLGGGIVTSGSAVGSTLPVLDSLTSKCQRAVLPMVSNVSLIAVICPVRHGLRESGPFHYPRARASEMDLKVSMYRW